MRLLLLVAGWCWMICPGYGQGAGGAPGTMPADGSAAPSFEVASIKPGRPDAQNSNLNFRPGHVVTENLTLRFLLQFAYGLSSGSNDQLVGGPSWVGSAPFDIDATEDEGLAKRLEAMSMEERSGVLRGMIQRLLADRFQLKVHHETRQLPVDALVVAKGGSRLTETAMTQATAEGSAAGPPRWSGLRHDGQGHIEGRGATMKMLASMLATLPEVGGRLVTDTTGLPGKYDFVLQWTPDEGTGGAGSGANGTEGGPSLFAALEEQMGLKVEAKKAPVEVLVIDHVEKPSEN